MPGEVDPQTMPHSFSAYEERPCHAIDAFRYRRWRSPPR
jgi:hypothetical protein